MHDLEKRYRLSPFGECSHTACNIFKADKRYQEDDTAENRSPEHSADEVVQYKILCLLAPVRDGPGVHGDVGEYSKSSDTEFLNGRASALPKGVD